MEEMFNEYAEPKDTSINRITTDKLNENEMKSFIKLLATL